MILNIEIKGTIKEVESFCETKMDIKTFIEKAEVKLSKKLKAKVRIHSCTHESGITLNPNPLITLKIEG